MASLHDIDEGDIERLNIIMERLFAKSRMLGAP
jgi:hypothetical protein